VVIFAFTLFESFFDCKGIFLKWNWNRNWNRNRNQKFI